ncbi:uncharacterized protein BDZ99DRAFT_545049, partial [Mytilinidion resinicola]
HVWPHRKHPAAPSGLQRCHRPACSISAARSPLGGSPSLLNSVSPGYMATEISDFLPQAPKDIWESKIFIGRKGQAGELKGAFLYLASDASSYTTGADMWLTGVIACLESG